MSYYLFFLVKTKINKRFTYTMTVGSFMHSPIKHLILIKGREEYLNSSDAIKVFDSV